MKQESDRRYIEEQLQMMRGEGTHGGTQGATLGDTTLVSCQVGDQHQGPPSEYHHPQPYPHSPNYPQRYPQRHPQRPPQLHLNSSPGAHAGPPVAVAPATSPAVLSQHSADTYAYGNDDIGGDVPLPSPVTITSKPQTITYKPKDCTLNPTYTQTFEPKL